ncbi:(+) H(+) exchange regulatory cofactor NHE-RF2-like isoform X4 [Argonauta hians]
MVASIPVNILLKKDSYGFGFGFQKLMQNGRIGIYVVDVLRNCCNNRSVMLYESDHILAINGCNLEAKNTNQIRELLKKSGHNVCLTILPNISKATNSTRNAILNNIPHYLRSTNQTWISKLIKNIRLMVEEPKGMFTVSISKSDLKFRLLGGTDYPIIRGYTGIHIVNVAKDIKYDGKGMELEEGDRLICVNNIRLNRVSLSYVDDVIRNAEQDTIRLVVSRQGVTPKEKDIPNIKSCMSTLTSPISLEIMFLTTLAFTISRFIP